MVSKIISLLPFMLVPALFFISAYMGFSLLFLSKEILIEKYQNLYYQFADRAPDNRGTYSYRKVVITGRLTGVFALAVCASAGFYAATNML